MQGTTASLFIRPLCWLGAFSANLFFTRVFALITEVIVIQINTTLIFSDTTKIFSLFLDTSGILLKFWTKFFSFTLVEFVVKCLGEGQCAV